MQAVVTGMAENGREFHGRDGVFVAPHPDSNDILHSRPAVPDSCLHNLRRRAGTKLPGYIKYPVHSKT